MQRRYWMWALMMFGCGLVGAFVHRGLQPPRAQASQAQPMQMESGTGDSTAPGAVTDGSGPSASSVAAGDRVEQDKECVELLARFGHGEAITWLTQGAANRGVAQWDKQEAIDLVKDFYAAGVKQVDVVDTDVAGESEIASQFILTLPADTESRAKIFQREARFEAEYGEDPTPDRGQKFLHITTN